MLVKLLPDQISKFWDVIRYAIEESLPPVAGEGPDKMNKILMSLLSGKSQCWASYVREEEQPRFEGLVVTKILYDDVSDTKNLLIYCLYGYDRVNRTTWKNGLKTLVKYAIGKNCHRIIGYTDVPFILETVKRLGGDTRYIFVSLPVRK